MIFSPKKTNSYDQKNMSNDQRQMNHHIQDSNIQLSNQQNKVTPSSIDTRGLPTQIHPYTLKAHILSNYLFIKQIQQYLEHHTRVQCIIKSQNIISRRVYSSIKSNFKGGLFTEFNSFFVIFLCIFALLTY